MTEIDIRSVPLTEIRESPLNPRRAFNDIDDLAADIAKRGVLQPVLVRPKPNGNGSKYELVFGARRFRAAQLAKLPAIPAMVREMDDEQALETMIVENAKRSDVHPLEEARSFHELQTRFKHDVARIAERVGRSVAYVYDRMKLLSLTKVAQQLFLAGDFTAGHAVILARLSPKDQERAMDQDEGGLWQYERGLPFDEDARSDPYKPASVRELQAWVDDHVKFNPAETDPMLFPETAAAVTEAKGKAEKVIPITYNYVTPPDGRDGNRVFTTQSWRRADGKEKSKTCEHSAIGVIVIGDGRGESFRVCTDKKKCKVHWADAQKAAKQRAKAASGTTGEDRYEAMRKKQEEETQRAEALRARWQKAMPAVLDAIAQKVKKLPAHATGQLADIVYDNFTDRYYQRVGKLQIQRGKTAEDLVRYLAFYSIARTVGGYHIVENLHKVAKSFGVDAKKILNEVAPEENPAAEKKPDAGDSKKAKAGRKS